MIPIILGLLLSFASAAYDYDKIFKNHRLRWGLRFVATTFLSFVGAYSFIEYIANALLIGAIFYATFDYVLNILAGRKWSYIGNTAKLDIKKKKAFGKYLVTLDLLTKISFLIVVHVIKII